MKQSLQLKMGQHLTMTPQLQQAIRLLQLSTLDLQQEIQEALDSNPMLEVADEFSGDDKSSGDSSDNNEPSLEGNATENHLDDNPFDNSFDNSSLDNSTLDNNADNSASADAHDDFTSDNSGNSESLDSNPVDSPDDWSNDIPEDLPVDTSWDEVYQPATPGPSSSGDEENSDFESRNSTAESLQDHMLWQLNLTPMSDRDRLIALSIIDAVAPSGMLSISLEEIYEGLISSLEELELDEVVAVQHRLQQFDPIGAASQNLSECLLVQLQQLPKETPQLQVAQRIVTEFLPLLGSRDYKLLMRKTKLKEAELRDIILLIQTLNPRPGDDIEQDDTQYVVPDVYVNKREDRWMVELNPDIAPKIRINNDYASMVKRADSSSDNTFLRDNLQEARWFLKSLQSRNETLLKVASCIVEKQRGFLDFGAEAMKPLVLHDVAEDVGMHESTISRVTTQKFMHTPQGIFELKYFFSSHVSTDSGGECSSTAIRAIIKKLVAAENAQKPLSDSKITTILADQGIKVARRTIAKYRESLGISASNERKRLL